MYKDDSKAVGCGVENAAYELEELAEPRPSTGKSNCYQLEEVNLDNPPEKSSTETVPDSTLEVHCVKPNLTGPIPVPGQDTSLIMRVKGVLTIAGGFLIHLSLGTFFTIGNMTPYIISYLRNREGYQVTYSYGIWINALSYLGQGSLMALGGLLEKRIGGRLTCFIGGCLFCGSIAVTGVLIRFGFVAVALVYGLLACIGLGIAYIPPLAAGMRWYPQQKGLVNGIILSGYGLGALVFNPVQTAFLNPKNENPEKDGYFYNDDILDRVPYVFYLLGGVYGSLQLIGILVLFKSPNDKAELSSDLLKHAKGTATDGKLYTVEDGTTNAGPQASGACYSLVPKDMGPCEMFKRKEFYIFWFTFALISQCIQFMNTYYKTFGQTFIHDDRFLSLVGSFASLCNFAGRIVWGRVQDMSSYKLVAVIITLSLTAFMMSFVALPYGGKVMFTIWVLAIFFLFAGTFSIMATGTAECFGSKNVGTNFGIVFTAPAASSILGAIVIQQLLSHIGWNGTIFTIGSFTFVGFIITMFMPDNLELVR